ncbi:hypothetical protein HMPREF0045_00152 [Actinomyces graevenitzii C83]|uniref:valine--tRNA ligase n=1 Tax=Actinomyces graevenitzii C83 TaxID=435830 RepID=G9PDR9_9ACTO|nr:hypothetical protein HMPREF0045_00152 [Actinomyces graevenitzii C83]
MGTGTFVARLLQLGVIPPEALERKYLQEIFANEVVLLSYYIASINIEQVYHQVRTEQGMDEGYVEFPGMTLTDTFQLHEGDGTITEDFEGLAANNERAKAEKESAITVIVMNPPYSSGQNSTNDNNQNLAYPRLDERIAATYAAKSTGANKNSLYDSYFRALRWASDRIGQRGVAGGFVGELDIMDTWATSSLSPQLACGWLDDEDLFARTYPMDLRPQGQDIIRTWLFSTVVRADLEFGALPWKHAGLSGWILDSDHKKMSKSKGNVVTPMGILEKYGSDAVRYWAASARLGLDAAFDEQQMKIGRRLAIKVLNASKFALTMGGEGAAIDLDPALVTVPLDRSVLAALASVIDEASAALASYEHSRALEVTESFFWTFCDDYLELVKERAYNRDGAWDEASAASARAALAIVIDNVVRLLAPYLPYVTEEVWSWYREGSVHTAPWPVSSDLADAQGDPSVLEAASSALIALRRVKSEAKVSPRTPFLAVTVRAPKAQVEALESVKGDLEAASKAVGALTVAASDDAEATEASVESFELGEAPAKRKG